MLRLDEESARKGLRAALALLGLLGLAAAAAAADLQPGDWQPVAGSDWRDGNCGEGHFESRAASSERGSAQALRLILRNATANDVEFSVGRFRVLFADGTTAFAMGVSRALPPGKETSLSHFWSWPKGAGIVDLSGVRIRCRATE